MLLAPFGQVEGKKGKSYLAPGSFSQGKEPDVGSTSQEVEPACLKELALHPMSCYAYDEGNFVLSPTVQRRDLILLVRVSHNVSTPIRPRRWLTMLGDRYRFETPWILGQCRA